MVAIDFNSTEKKEKKKSIATVATKILQNNFCIQHLYSEEERNSYRFGTTLG